MGKGKKIIEERPSALVQISVGYQTNIVFGKFHNINKPISLVRFSLLPSFQKFPDVIGSCRYYVQLKCKHIIKIPTNA